MVSFETAILIPVSSPRPRRLRDAGSPAGGPRRLPRRLRTLDVVDVEFLGFQVNVEPIDDVLQTLHAMPRAARARQLVRLAREAYHDHGAMQILQCPEHLLT